MYLRTISVSVVLVQRLVHCNAGRIDREDVPVLVRQEVHRAGSHRPTGPGAGPTLQWLLISGMIVKGTIILPIAAQAV